VAGLHLGAPRPMRAWRERVPGTPLTTPDPAPPRWCRSRRV